MFGFMSVGLLELIERQTPIRKSKRPRTSTRRFKQRLYWRDGGQCVYCDKPIPFDKATQDHITPRVWLGDCRSKENVAIACRNCNQKKGPYVLDELGDLSPEALKAKFEAVYKAQQQPKGINPYFLQS